MLRALRAFTALHRRGTIAAAAEEVHLSAAAVSAQLKLLETRLGTSLLTRTGRSVELTSAGIRLLPLAEKMLATYDELLDLGSDAALRGRVSLGVINSVLLGVFPRVLQRLKADHPHLMIKVVTGTSPELVAQVEAGLLDAAVVTQSPAPLHETLSVLLLFDDPVALVQSSPAAYASVAEAVAGAEYIALDRTTWVGRVVDRHLLQAGIHVEPSLELNSQEAVLAAVRCGLGVSILPMIRAGTATIDRTVSYQPIEGLSRTVALVEKKVHAHAHVTQELANVIRDMAGSRGQS